MKITAEAIREALDTLSAAGYVVKAWCREDIEGELDVSYPELTAERRDEVVNAAMDSRYWAKLSDCTDHDWMLVWWAIDEALDSTEDKTRTVAP